jgi:acetolactate synthase-1/2/3 large subunit
MMRVASAGVKPVFMVSGRGALFLTDALAANKELTAVCTHHEQAAAFAAVAYADRSGKPGVCLVSTGCAATNAMTGVLNAWQDGHPCVFISGQNKLAETSRFTGIPLRTYGQQEADIVSLVQPITKYAVMITDPKKIAYELDKAFFLAEQGRKGPVWIDIPLDVQNMRVDPDALERFVPDPGPLNEPKPDDLLHFKNALDAAQRPLILIGSGVRFAGAESALKRFAEARSIPVVYAPSAPDSYGTENRLGIGSVGTMGCSRAANFAVQNSDLLLVVGCRLTSMTTGTEFEKFARHARIFVVDIDRVEHSKKGVRIERLILSDARKFLEAMLAEEIRPAPAEWTSKCLHWKEIFPKCEPAHKSATKVDLYHLAEALSELLPPNASFVSDSGLCELILPTNIRFRAGQRAIHPASQGSMGYALPAAIGAHFAGAGPVVTVVGDGSIMMNIQELATIRHHGIPAKIFVINNNAYAIIRKRQAELFGSRTLGTDPGNGVSCPDFRKVAAGFDLPYARIESGRNLNAELSAVLETDGPVLCEVMGLEDQDYIRSAHARDSKNRFVGRPIEDQAPFLDRELFRSEMIVEPIDQ